MVWLCGCVFMCLGCLTGKCVTFSWTKKKKKIIPCLCSLLQPSGFPIGHDGPSRPGSLSSRGQSSNVVPADMADREGLPLPPGQVCIEVEYDYEYKAKDKMVSIRQGECYILVKKTNEDWWQVRKEEGTKAFYVPAQYVREVRRALMPPQKPTLRAKPTVLDICRASNENLNRPPLEMSSFGRPSPSSTPSPSSDRVTPPALPKDANQNMGSPHHCKVVAELVLLHNNNNHHLTNNSTLPRTRADSPPLKDGNNHNKSPDSDKTSPSSDLPGERLNKIRTDSESGDELSSSSTEHMQVRITFHVMHLQPMCCAFFGKGIVCLKNQSLSKFA